MITEYFSLNKDGSIASHNSEAIIDLRDDEDVQMIWPREDSGREWAWRFLVETIACGADNKKISQIAEKWKCDDADAEVYARIIGVVLSVDEKKKMAATKSFTNIQESPCGFGETYLEAMSNLCAALGYKPQKMWGATFASLVKKHNEKQVTA